jgi:uncharacterized protein (DUF1499 family)
MQPSSILLSASMLALLTGCAGAPKHLTQSPSSQTFTPCSVAPHCVSSQAAHGIHYVAPFSYTGSAQHAREVLLQTLRSSGSASVEEVDNGIVHATFRSTLGFVDDVTFLIKPEQNIIDVKSSSRIGFSDLGVNSRRVERLRASFESLLKGS